LPTPFSSPLFLLDAGNTRLKAALYGPGEDRIFREFLNSDTGGIENLLRDWGRFPTMVCSSRGNEASLRASLSGSSVYFLDWEMVPGFRPAYAQPETMGKDRLASIAGALARFPGRALCVADAGTCLTTDFLSPEGLHLGGTISPGLEMRLQSLQAFTGSLPRVAAAGPLPGLGNSTETCIRSGAAGGLILELDSLVSSTRARFGLVFELVLTGGDAKFLADRLKTDNFVAPHLVFEGLFAVLKSRIST
jgi:type III pantothenate kinase